MSPSVAEPSAINVHGYLQAKRTEALPKHTLFGSNIEQLDDNQKKELGELDLSKYQCDIDRDRKRQQDRYKCTLPEHLHKVISDDPLTYSQNELTKQAQQTQRSAKLMNMLQEKSKYFSVGSSGNQKSSPGFKESPWMNNSHLIHGNAINIVGAGGTTSYNHAKYQPKPAIHNYSLAGDPIKLGMDFPTSSAPQKLPHVFRLERMGPPDRMPKDFYLKSSSDENDEKCAIKLPPNIKHQFGTSICHNVLSSKIKVEETLEQQKKHKQRFLKSGQQRASQLVNLNPDIIDPAYESLGAALRLDFFPGNSYNHKRSVATSVYTSDVHKQRVPDPDEHRYQRDYLSTWAEQNVLRERVKKAWDTYLQETLSKN